MILPSPWDEKGYGIASLRGKTVKAHRVAYVAANGDIPNGMGVLHRCDVRCCVNPRHLYVGDQKKNMADRHQRGRTARGERNGKTKLSDQEVSMIRLLHERLRLRVPQIARMLSTPDSTIRGIVSGERRKSWE